jgi:hypothetical protein
VPVRKARRGKLLCSVTFVHKASFPGDHLPEGVRQQKIVTGRVNMLL